MRSLTSSRTVVAQPIQMTPATRLPDPCAGVAQFYPTFGSGQDFQVFRVQETGNRKVFTGTTFRLRPAAKVAQNQVYFAFFAITNGGTACPEQIVEQLYTLSWTMIANQASADGRPKDGNQAPPGPV